MEPPIFYVPPENIRGDEIALPASETHHAADVLRLRSGALVLVVDGLGTAYRGEIKLGTGKHASVQVHSIIRNFGEPGVRLTLAAGLSVGYKFDEVVDKGTQLGVVRFAPIITEKSRVKIEDPKRASSKTARLEKVALAAMKQCRRSYRPEIALPISFKRYLQEADRDSLKLIFHPSKSSGSLAEALGDKIPKRITVLVGPEAGFSPDEEQSAVSHGFIPVSLGQRILRTETAGPVACALVMEKIGELR